MSSRRLLKAAAAVRQVVSMAIISDLKDPRVRDVTVTHVEMTPDMREAKVYVSIMGDATHQNLSLRGLQHARGFLQAKIAERIETRYTPRLRFLIDMGVKRSIEVAEILDRVLSEDKRSDNAAADEMDESDECDNPSEDEFEDNNGEEGDDFDPGSPRHAR
jgi:ribosome-binding factor A